MGLYEGYVSQFMWCGVHELCLVYIWSLDFTIGENIGNQGIEMSSKEKKKLLFIFVIVFLLAVITDITSGNLQEGDVLNRGEQGAEEETVVLRLDAEGILENYVYELVIEPIHITKDEAEKLFSQTKKEIEDAFSKYETKLPIKENYAANLVEADWRFAPSGYIDSEGTFIQDQIPEEGILINVVATLTCGRYEEIYGFPIYITRKEATRQEKLLEEIHIWIQTQMKQEGNESIQLPQEMEGVELSWSEEKESLTLQVLFLEIIAMILIHFLKKKEQKDRDEKRKREIEYVYSDIVSQLSLLLESGMTMRQAWLRMAEQYAKKKEQNFAKGNPVYEALLPMSRRLLEGESERVVYESFAEEIGVPCYRRLIRSLIGNLEKGRNEICEYLEEEEKRAYDEKILLAKKLGEEASTKMIVPLMLMMMLVMAVVLAPAMIGFFN